MCTARVDGINEARVDLFQDLAGDHVLALVEHQIALGFPDLFVRDTAHTVDPGRGALAGVVLAVRTL